MPDRHPITGRGPVDLHGKPVRVQKDRPGKFNEAAWLPAAGRERDPREPLH